VVKIYQIEKFAAAFYVLATDPMPKAAKSEALASTLCLLKQICQSWELLAA